MSVSCTDETYENDIKNIQLNFTQILTSGCYYNTSEIINHIKHINNAFDNIKLDYEFQRGSKNWIKQFDPNEMKLNETNIKQLIARGNELIQQLITRLHIDIIKSKEQNQIRIINNWACDSLLEYLQALEPFASNSYARLDNLAHDLGVTDRYVGYRNNLTRYENSHNLWADRKLPQTSTPDWKDWTHAFQHKTTSNDNRNVLKPIEKTSSMKIQPPNTTKKIVSSSSFTYTNDPYSEMNTKYPGKSETADRYTKPERSPYSPSLAVAQPDFTCIGRPLARLVPKASFSEYTDRYTIPDTSKIERYPWLRP